MDFLFHLVTPFGLSMFITILLIPVWISVCRKWKLFDEPDKRKHHVNMTPSMGGIAIYAGLFISFLSFAEIADHEKIRFLFGATLILFFTGFFDDLMDVPPMKKMVFQAISTCVIYYGGFRILDLNGILWIHEIPVFLQLPLTLLLVVMFTNAFNFIDGVDGLAGSLGVVATSCMGALFFHYGKEDFAVLSFCITGALLGFLFYNFSPAKIFMGDTGSLVVGFLLAALSIELLNTGTANPDIAVNPSFIFAILFLPLFDITRVFIIRMLNGTSPFHADRNHLHHLILSFGFGHRSTSLMMAAFSLFIVLLQVLLDSISVNLFIAISIALGLAFMNNKVFRLLAVVHHRIFGNQKAKDVRIRAN